MTSQNTQEIFRKIVSYFDEQKMLQKEMVSLEAGDDSYVEALLADPFFVEMLEELYEVSLDPADDIESAKSALRGFRELRKQHGASLFSNKTNQQIGALGKAIAGDGRYLLSWRENTEEIAAELGVQLDQAAKDRLAFAANTFLDPVIPPTGPLPPKINIPNIDPALLPGGPRVPQFPNINPDNPGSDNPLGGPRVPQFPNINPDNPGSDNPLGGPRVPQFPNINPDNPGGDNPLGGPRVPQFPNTGQPPIKDGNIVSLVITTVVIAYVALKIDEAPPELSDVEQPPTDDIL